MASRKFIKTKFQRMRDDLYNTGQCKIGEKDIDMLLNMIEEMEDALMERKKEITRLRKELGE